MLYLSANAIRNMQMWEICHVKPQGFYMAASLGFEPRQRDSESLVLPLHHEATSEKIKDR